VALGWSGHGTAYEGSRPDPILAKAQQLTIDVATVTGESRSAPDDHAPPARTIWYMIEATANTSATPLRAWEVFSDVTAWPEMLPTVDAVEPIGGAEQRPAVDAAYVVRQPRLPKARWVITDWRPGEAFTWVSVAPGIRTTGVHEVAETSGGPTTIRVGIDWSGPMAWLARLFYSRLARRYLVAEATTFARVAEGGSR